VSASVNINSLSILRDLGEELRRIRIEAGYRSQVNVARLLKCSQNKVSYIERGKRWPDDDLLKRMFRLYEVSEPKQADIRATIRAGQSIQRPWWDESRYREAFPGGGAQIFPLEDAAERIWVHSGTYIPGLLQIQEYIEALAEFGQKDESAQHREAFVEARLRRQDILSRSYPLTLNALVLEAALHSAVGGQAVMQAQLRHLRKMAERTNITVRLIPFSAGAAAASGTPLTVIDFPGAENKSVALYEKPRTEEVTEDISEVRRARRLMARLANLALDPVETLHRIEEIEKTL
jgi:transcriptional regulator with XRE-family HTH domain